MSHSVEIAPIELRRSGLLVVDAQRGFTNLCPQELPVPGGVEITPNVNRLLALAWARIDASQDWHPPDHRSFLGQKDNLYPPHCVAGTLGAASVEEVAFELGGAIGITILGSLLAGVYSAVLVLPSGLPPSVREGIDQALRVAETLPAEAGHLLTESVYAAFDAAYLSALALAAVLLVAVAVMARRARAVHRARA